MGPGFLNMSTPSETTDININYDIGITSNVQDSSSAVYEKSFELLIIFILTHLILFIRQL
jgi:hypothetical protein